MRHLLVLTLIAGGWSALRAEDACHGCQGLKVGGFVDASYSGDLEQGGDQFRLDQVEVDFEHHAQDGLVLRADVQSDGDGNLDIEQGFVKLPLPYLAKHSLSFGKFNAPMGVELLDAPDMYQFSHSLLFDNGLPTNLTGAQLDGPIGYGLDYKLFVVNGWDQNDDSNANRSFGGRLGYTHDKLGGLGVSFITGREEGIKTAGKEDLQVIDVDYLVKPLGTLAVFAELNLGSVKPVGGESLGWTGIMLGGHYDFTDVWGCTLRYDMITDDDGVLFGATEGETRSALTAALTAAAGPGRAIVFEYRMDSSDEDVFLDADGEPTGSSSTLALEFTQSF